MNQVRRRQFLLAAGALLVAPIVAQAQTATKLYRIGLLGVLSPELLKHSLRELGYVEGRDVVFEVRDAEGRLERFDHLALDLVRLKVDVIVASNPPATLSAKRATATIPIVMMNSPDPVQLGIVASLAKPGKNITGVTTLSADCIKQLEFLKEAVPRASRVALLWNPDDPWHSVTVKSLQARSFSCWLGPLSLTVRLVDLHPQNRIRSGASHKSLDMNHRIFGDRSPHLRHQATSAAPYSLPCADASSVSSRSSVYLQSINGLKLRKRAV